MKAQHCFFANGQQIGSFGQLSNEHNIFEANFDVNFTPVSPGYPTAVPAQVIVQEGETLRSLAMRVLGDASLWYLIAEENGLTDPDAQLTAGTVLLIPNEVISLGNTASSFKPFDIGEVIGDTTPTQPAPPPPRKKKGCGVLGQIIVIVVAVIVTIYTYGATSEFLAAAWGSNFWAATAAGAIGAGAGSLASQGVAIAIGQQDGFSWKQLAAATLSGGPGGAATAALSGIGGVTGQVITAATNSAISQGVNIALGLQSEFNWGAVAAAAVAAPVAASAEKGIRDAMGGSYGKGFTDFTVALAKGGIQQVTSLAFNGGKIDYANLVADAFGNALGNSIVAKSSSPGTAAVAVGSGGDGSGSFDPSPYRNRALDELSLSDLGTEAGLSNNPSGAVYQPGAELSPDELANLATITVQGTRINAGDDVGLDIFAGLYQQSWQMNREQRALVDQIGEAAGTNYEWRQRYGRNALWATDQIASGYDALTGARAGAGQRLLALGYNGGPASWGERVAGTLIGGTQGVMEGVGLGTMGMLEFGRDAAGAAGYLLTGSSYLESSYERYGATAAGLVDFLSDDPLGTLGGALRDYGSRVVLLNSADPSLSGRIAGKPFGELVAPGAALGTGVRGLRGLSPWLQRPLQSPIYLDLQPGAAAYSGIPIGVRSPFAAEVAAPSLGRFGSADAFANAAYGRYQQFVDEGYDLALLADSKGLLGGAPNTRIGNYVDRYSRDAFNEWLEVEGLSEGIGSSVQVNRRLRDPFGSRAYGRPDIQIPGANLILDATVGLKWSDTPQITTFRSFSGGDRITIVRPTQLGGSYSILP